MLIDEIISSGMRSACQAASVGTAPFIPIDFIMIINYNVPAILCLSLRVQYSLIFTAG
jgi:hypothetical protein